MGTPRRILLVASCVAALGGIAWLLAESCAQHEPMYQGEPLTYWLNGDAPVITRAPIKGPTLTNLLNDPDQMVRMTAANALDEIAKASLTNSAIAK
jgi:hypothetical protein